MKGEARMELIFYRNCTLISIVVAAIVYTVCALLITKSHKEEVKEKEVVVLERGLEKCLIKEEY